VNALEVDRASVSYGVVRGANQVTLTVADGEIVALLGANGAGKTTVLNAISGLVKLTTGSITAFGQDLGKMAPHQRVRFGVVQVPEGRRIFGTLTVRENLELATQALRYNRATRGRHVNRALASFPLLARHVDKVAGMLSGGEQQLLAIARGMLSRPRLLLVDEPSLGLAPQMLELVYDQLKTIARDHTPVLLVEQNVAMALGTANRAYVLQNGSLVLSGNASDLAADERVKAAYLGAEA
jgi:branched-chain amino acid transport system ATP-binding protein